MENKTVTTPKSQDAPVAVLPRTIHLVPMDHIDGFDVRPGFYEINGATAIPGGVNFTVHSYGAQTLPYRQCILHDRI